MVDQCRVGEFRIAAAFAILVASLPGVARGQGTVFRYAEDKAPSTLNPLFAMSLTDVRLNELMFDGLYTLDHYLKATPALAKSCTAGTARCEDGPAKVVTVTLKDAKWDDGKPVTTADVEFSIKALRDPKTGSPNASKAACIDKVEVQGPKDMRITFASEQLDPPSCLMFKVLPNHKFGGTLPVPRANEFRIKPVGSGAYKLAKWEGTTLDMERTSDQAGLKVMQARFIPDKKVQLDFLQYDALEAIVKILPNHRTIIEGLGSKVELVPYASQSWWYIGVNHKNTHLANRSVREAIVHALDRDDLRKSFLGEGATISGPFAPRSPYYNDEVEPYPYDLSATERLMKEAGYKRNGKGPYVHGGKVVKLRLAISKDMAEYKDVCLTMQNKLKQAGFEVDLEWIEQAAWAEKIVQKKDFDLTLGVWAFEDSAGIDSLFHSSGADNYFNYSSQAMDSLIDESRKTQNPELFNGIYKEIHKVSHKELPYLFLWSVNSYAAITSKVTGVDIHPYYFFTWIREWKWRS